MLLVSPVLRFANQGAVWQGGKQQKAYTTYCIYDWS